MSRLAPSTANESGGNTPAIMPERRDLHFSFPGDRITSWHGLGPNVTHFFNTLSLFFPEGERFFIDSVRHYRDRIPDPDLKKAATGFIGQEAMHSREHIEYNEALEAAGLPAARLDRSIGKLLQRVRDNTPPAMQLSVTIALEHFTATLGGMVLREPELLRQAQEDFARLWRWHALEEVEHKAVAYDVYEKVIGRGPLAYGLRIAGFVGASALFWALVLRYYLQLVGADPDARAQGWRGHLRLAKFLFGRPGAIRRVLPEWLGYFRYSFHPWQQDDSHLLAGLDELVAETEATYKT